MLTGFTYNGRHSGDLGLWYAPEADDRWFNSPDFSVVDADVSWRDGGIYYGTNYKKRTFSLKCFAEEISPAKREEIRRWLSPMQRGKLVFDDRPYVTYDVIPTKQVSGKAYYALDQFQSGPVISATCTITFTAYNPFGVQDTSTEAGRSACGMADTGWLTGQPTTSSRDFLVYNPGTERIPLSMYFKGTATNGMTITNDTNQDKCVLFALPPVTSWLSINGDNGYIKVGNRTDNDTSGFEYHNWGMIMLDPGMPSEPFAIHTVSGSNVVTVEKAGIPERAVGKYIRLGNEWVRVSAKANSTIIISKNAQTTGDFTTQFAAVNRIMIEGTGVSQTGFEIGFTPRIA